MSVFQHRNAPTLSAPAQPAAANCRTTLHGRTWLLGLAIGLLAQGAAAQRFGDWQVDRNRELVVAVTQNSSDSVLGYACNRSNNQCLFFFMPDRLKCNEGGRYALLINGGRESSSRATTCKRLDWQDGQQFANVLDSSDALRNQLVNADGSTLGIARGTGADGFSVSKFSMRGFREAFDKVNRFRDRDDRDSRGPLRDYNTDQSRGGSDIQLFEHGDFQGRRLDGRTDISNMQDVQFNDVVSSIVVLRGRWQLCTDAYFAGRCSVYGPGRYASVGPDNDLYSSFRRVN